MQAAAHGSCTYGVAIAALPASPTQFPQHPQSPLHALISTLTPNPCQELSTSAFGNPHSVTPSSVRASHAVEGVRAALLKLFDADPAQYELVFTRRCAAGGTAGRQACSFKTWGAQVSVGLLVHLLVCLLA